MQLQVLVGTHIEPSMHPQSFQKWNGASHREMVPECGTSRKWMGRGDGRGTLEG